MINRCLHDISDNGRVFNLHARSVLYVISRFANFRTIFHFLSSYCLVAQIFHVWSSSSSQRFVNRRCTNDHIQSIPDDLVEGHERSIKTIRSMCENVMVFGVLAEVGSAILLMDLQLIRYYLQLYFRFGQLFFVRLCFETDSLMLTIFISCLVVHSILCFHWSVENVWWCD